MKNCWLYYRLSRDEDKEQNSLNNQRDILVEYAKKNNMSIVGESFDDNVSGMHFNRDGILELQTAVDENLIDTVLVKDLSRLGRHKTQTALFIDYLRTADVNVYSVTENINTLDENDDLIIGFKGLINDSYAKDISKKIRHGFKQKQKQGIVITPPFGYLKDKNSGEINIIAECADIIKLIFELYLDGMGSKKIANYLTEKGYKTPSYYQKQFLGKSNPQDRTIYANKWVWHDSSVSTILNNEAYIGTLICGKTSHNSIYHTRRLTNEDEQFVHENFYNPIISKDIWNKAQLIRNSRSKTPVRASTNSKIHKYAGLIKCGECNSTFTTKKRPDYIEYVCNTYHRRGASFCTPHRIKEKDLDILLKAYLLKIKSKSEDVFNGIDTKIKDLSEFKSDTTTVKKMDIKIDELNDENKNLIRQMIKYPDREDVFNEMITENENQIKHINSQKDNIINMNKTNDSVKTNIEKTLKMLKEVLKKDKLNYVDIHSIIDSIVVSEDKEGMIDIKFNPITVANYVLDLYNCIFTEELSSCDDCYSVISKLANVF